MGFVAPTLYHHLIELNKMDTKSKIALVTGSSRGLGKNMAIKLAQKGVDVILTYNSKKEEALAVVAEIEEAGQKKPQPYS